MERPLPSRRPTSRPVLNNHSCRRAAFTLVELLITIAIIGLLLAILLPALASSIRAARGIRCQVSLRGVGFDFAIFADEALHGDRGNDLHDLGPRRFRLETFQDSQYGLAEFWRWGSANAHTLPDAANNDPMRCAEVRGPVTLQNNTPCSQGAITPPQNISYTFNMRLYRPEGRFNGLPVLLPVTLTSSIMEHGRVPLAWDTDGATAASRGVVPVFSAPSLGSTGPYANNFFWFPAQRHNGAINVAFIDGSVLATTHPLQETGWDWSYQPAH